MEKNNTLPHVKMTPTNWRMKMKKAVVGRKSWTGCSGVMRVAGGKGKSRLLDEFCGYYGYDRKHAIKWLFELGRQTDL